MVNFTYFTQLEGKTITRVDVSTSTGYTPYNGVTLHCTDATQIEIGAASLGFEIADGAPYDKGYDDGYAAGKSDKTDEIIEMIQNS